MFEDCGQSKYVPKEETKHRKREIKDQVKQEEDGELPTSSFSII